MEKMINKANYNSFAQLTDIATTSNGIDKLLEIVCELCASPRANIFEFSNNNTRFSTTYQYSKNPELVFQPDLLKDEPVEQIEWFFESFQKTEAVFTENVEELKVIHPATYSILKSRNIESMLAVPMIIDNTLIGFVGIDNPQAEINKAVLDLLHMYSTFVARSILILTLSRENEFLKTHDPLTMAFNRRAFELRIEQINQEQSLGIVFCDISELKKTNRYQGYKHGNKLLYKLSEALIHIFHDHPVYRTGSDEFVILCSNISQYDFDYNISVLKRYISQNKQHVSVGTCYKSVHAIVNIMDLLSLAERDMFKDKANYYCNIDPLSGRSRERRLLNNSLRNNSSDIIDSKDRCSIKFSNNSILKHFVNSNYFDMDVFINSMSMAEHYPYFGDMQNNTFYASEPIRKILGISHPIIKNLLSVWENFIPYKEELAMYKADIQDILVNKKEYHDLRYKVRDLNGNEFWVHCFGIIKWDKEKTKPLFFSGAVSKLSHSFTIDPVTALPKEQLASVKITEYHRNNKRPAYIGFKINNFEEINELRGRSTANSLLKDISKVIVRQYESKVDLYRLDGLRFMVIIPSEYSHEITEIGMGIKNIIKKLYNEYNIAVRFPCVMGIIEQVNYGISSLDIISNVISLIEVAKASPETDIVYYTQMVQNHKNKNLMMMALSRDVADDFRNFYTVIQPVVSSKTHKVVSGELLLRWRYEGENISPMTFIPMLEQQGLIIPVGKWIFEQAVSHCKRMLTLKPDFYLNFNISYHQILDNSLTDYMKSTLEQWQLNPDRLVAELTETHYNDHPTQLSEFIDMCKNINMRVALDDFGVGYSSLDLLLQYHSDIVKLDRSLVTRMTASEKSNDFITSIVYACHKFGKTVCVEGVETQEEAQMVTEAGCDVIQGYYFHKPIDVMQVYELLSQENV